MLDVIRNGNAQVVINTMDKNRSSANQDGFSIRREAVEHGIPLFTSLDSKCDFKSFRIKSRQPFSKNLEQSSEEDCSRFFEEIENHL